MSRSINKRPLIAHVNPKSPVSEAYRTLRTNIDFSSIDETVCTILLTSAGPGEGKSTTAANLAVTYAQAGKRVLLVDADLRKPTMHKTFGLSNRAGLSLLLSNQKQTLNDIIMETHVQNLDIITSGPVPPNPSELLASKRMTMMLEELKTYYDAIIIDTPPALAVTDAQVLSTKCDGVLLVLDSGSVKREAALKVKSNLEMVKARILGVILNNVSRKNGEAYYYYYYGNKENNA